VDHETVERLGPEGHYEPYYDIEKESVKVNGTTTRTIERTFARDAFHDTHCRHAVRVPTVILE